MTIERLHSSVVVLGSGRSLERVVEAWQQTERATRVVGREVQATHGLQFDPNFLLPFPSDEWVAFVAHSNDRLNSVRRMLANAVRQQGYRLATFISPRSYAPRGVNVGANSFIGECAAIGVGATIDDNCWIDSGAIVGAGAKIGHSSWIGAGAVLGNEVIIGEDTTVASGAIIADGVLVGKRCELLVAREYRDSLADKTFIHPRFGDVRIYG